MKKIIKPLLIIVIIVAVTITGLYFGYKYKQGKKTAAVVPVENFSSDGLWWDTIQSYGEVTAEKAQTSYISSGTEIVSVNVKEGDHVNEGDVIIVVKKESQDRNNKLLQIQKAQQALKVSQIKMERLVHMTPAPDPENVSTNDETREIEYVSNVSYTAKNDFNNGYGGLYKEGDVVASQNFDVNGKSEGVTYYLYDRHGSGDDEIVSSSTITESEYKGDYPITDGDHISSSSTSSEFSYIRRTYYYDSLSQRVVGEIVYDMNGDVEFEKKVPTGLSAKQIEEDLETTQTEIKRQDLDLRKLQNEYEQMLNTDDTGEIRAKVSGTVSKIQSIDNYNASQPFFIITATDEYYISGSLGEFYLDSVKVGDSVSISSWETGNTAEAVITEISDSPADSNNSNFWGGSGNTNSSNYEFKASFDKSSGIEIGSAVDITITPAGSEEKGLYIPNYLIKKDASGSYVMKMNDKNKLEKVYVKVGKSMYGEMSEVKSGVSKEDCLAFPYGNGAIEGIQCEQKESFDDYEGGLG